MKDVMKCVLVLIAVIVLLYGISMFEDFQYNDGICPNCNIELQVAGVSKGRRLVWYCEDCLYRCTY